jgi:hypothetical protein
VANVTCCLLIKHDWSTKSHNKTIFFQMEHIEQRHTHLKNLLHFLFFLHPPPCRRLPLLYCLAAVGGGRVGIISGYSNTHKKINDQGLESKYKDF